MYTKGLQQTIIIWGDTNNLLPYKKSCIQKTKNLSIDVDSISCSFLFAAADKEAGSKYKKTTKTFIYFYQTKNAGGGGGETKKGKETKHCS